MRFSKYSIAAGDCAGRTPAVSATDNDPIK
jgi:hypothetical protein